MGAGRRVARREERADGGMHYKSGAKSLISANELLWKDFKDLPKVNRVVVFDEKMLRHCVSDQDLSRFWILSLASRERPLAENCVTVPEAP